MVEPISTAGAVIGVGKSVLQVMEQIRGIADSSVISAYFKWDGSRIEGSDKIEVERIFEDEAPHEMDGMWWFSVKEVEDYAFVRMPLVESGLDELLGWAGGVMADARYWRWIARPQTGTFVGGKWLVVPPNVKVDFIVVGYKPKALLEHFKS